MASVYKTRMSKNLKKWAAPGARPAIQYVLCHASDARIIGGTGTATYIVATRMVGIMRSGMASKMKRESNQAAGLGTLCWPANILSTLLMNAPVVTPGTLSQKERTRLDNMVQRAQRRERHKSTLNGISDHRRLPLRSNINIPRRRGSPHVTGTPQL